MYVPDCPNIILHVLDPFSVNVPVPGPLAVPSGKAEESDSDSKKRKQKSIKSFLAKFFWNSVGC